MRSADRIVHLDAVRGVAVLGILAVNIISFAWPLDAMLAMQKLPMAVDGVLQGQDRIAAWAIEALFMDKFRTLFCLLFGVSLFLIGGDKTDTDKHRKLRRRLGWLALFGVIHGLVFWFGDILLLYAVAGMLAMLARGLSGKALLWIGAGVTGSLMIIQAILGGFLPYMPTDIANAFEGHAQVTTAQLIADAQTSRASYGAHWFQNLLDWALVQGMSLTLMLPPVIALMLLGMGLFKIGFFHGRLSPLVYTAIVVLGMAALALKGWAAWQEGLFPPEAMPSRGMNMVGSSLAVFISLAYASLIIKLPALFAWARPVGQMAFTTYLGQTLLMTTLFTMPWGPKLYGQLGPAQLWGVMAIVWGTQILFAFVWLKFYRWGPLEWVWRSLTEGKRLPLSKTKA